MLLKQTAFLAHLSRRRTRRAYSIGMFRRPSVRRRPSSTISKIFSETAWPIKLNFHLESPWEKGKRVFSRDLGYMTKMATTLIPRYGPSPFSLIRSLLFQKGLLVLCLSYMVKTLETFFFSRTVEPPWVGGMKV